MNQHQRVLELAKQLLQSGDIATAQEILEPVIRQDAGATEVRFYLALCYFRLGEFTIAEKHFREVAKRSPSDHNAAYYLGLSLEKQGRMDAALTAFQTALRLKPDFAQARQKIVAYAAPAQPKSQEGRRGSPAHPPARKWSWYSTRADDPEPPFLHKVAHWGCFAFVILFFLVFIALVVGLILSQGR